MSKAHELWKHAKSCLTSPFAMHEKKKEICIFGSINANETGKVCKRTSLSTFRTKTSHERDLIKP